MQTLYKISCLDKRGTNLRHAGVIIVVSGDKWVLGGDWAMGNGRLSLFLAGQFQVILLSNTCPANVQPQYNVQPTFWIV